MSQDVFNCEYFDKLKADWQAGIIDHEKTKIALLLLPQGQKILSWIQRPISPEPHNILTIEKFDQ